MALRMTRPTTRPNTSFLTFRRALPTDLKAGWEPRKVVVVFPACGAEPAYTATATVTQNGVRFSLRTRDPSVAKARAGIAEDHLQRLFAGLRNGPMRLTHKQVVALSGEWYRGFVTNLEDDPGEARVLEQLQEACASPDQGEPDDCLSVFWQMADRALAGRAMVVDADSRRRLALAIKRAIAEAMGTLKRRADGDYGPDQIVERFPPELPQGEATPRPAIPQVEPVGAAGPPADKGRSDQGLSLASLVDGWAKERKPRAATVGVARRVVEVFSQQCGKENAKDITPDDVVAWKDALVAEGALSTKTINGKYLTPLNTVLNWASNNRKIPANPAKGVRSVGKAPPRTRKPEFTAEEARTILSASLHAHEERGRTAQELLDARRWVPWLCAYSGARVVEITQLRGVDFQEEEGVPVFVITPEAGNVKTDTARVVPIHPDLIRQGLLEFVKAKGGGPLFHRPGTKAPVVAGRLSEWVRKIGVKDPKVQPNHAWRHLFVTLCRRHEVTDEARYAITGHTKADTGQTYGSMPAGMLLRELSKVPAFAVGQP